MYREQLLEARSGSSRAEDFLRIISALRANRPKANRSAARFQRGLEGLGLGSTCSRRFFLFPDLHDSDWWYLVECSPTSFDDREVPLA